MNISKSMVKCFVLRSAKFVALLLVAAVGAFAQVNVTTQHNDLARTGQNLNETVLTPANVNMNQFGLFFKAPVDNQVYAQPLVLTNVSIGGGTHNVVFVATTSNSVYAFDADNGTQYWRMNLGTPIANTDYGAGCVDINGKAGIVGTPVIDPATGTLYVVNSLNSNGTFSFMLHALSVSTGLDKAGSPVQITNSALTPLLQNQRAALALSNGNVLIPFSSHCDMGAYHGLLFAYNATTLAQVAVFNTSPTGSGNSLWMSGQGPAIDGAGNIYFGTSNGTWDGASNFSESFIKLNSNLTLADWFTPANHANLDGGDLDLDTSGPLLVPPGNRLIMVGKSATGYVINSANLGHLGDASAVQTITLGGALHGSAVYWNGATNGPEVYMWAQGDNLKAFQFNGNTLTTPNFQTGPVFIGGEPGAYLSVSANGNTNGIVWANAVLSGDANHGTIPGVLRAFNATNITTELYNNQQNAGRDTCNNFAKNGYPAIANGKVYLGSFGTADTNSGQLCVYTVLPTNCTVPTVASALTATAVSSSQVNLSWTVGTSNCPVSYSIFRSTTPGFTPSASNQIANAIFATTFSDTTTVASTAYNYVVEATTLAGASAPSNQASVTTPVGLSALAINSGGNAAGNFIADVDFNGGGASSTTQVMDTSAVTNPAPQAVYQSERFGNFTYTIPGFNPGAPYTVRLHFAEFFWSMAGQRVFNVLMNGTQVLTNFDIIAAAGVANKAIVEQFNVNANSNGQFVIQYVTVKDNAKSSGIEITSNGSCTAPTTPSGLTATAFSSSQINLSWAASTSSCTVSYSIFRSTTSGFTPSSSNQIANGVTGTSSSNTGLAASTTYFYLVEAVNSAGTSGPSNQASASTTAGTGGPIQINAGGPAVSPFLADQDFTGGRTINHANTIDLSGVTNPAPAAVYQTARIGNYSYTIGGFGAGSSHTVRLHFAETFWTTAGSRIFNVSMNGTQVLTNFDIFAAAGAQNKALIQQFTATANSSGQFVIQFTTVKDNALVSGLEVQ
ncbi:MAG TPA: malectin domain-containing carbohydrate-binding protein [Candidatus Angelobacter sp.]|nr:malectin domain-containing carbohydrate-binding protein [Candidatus Angelobacter sp.]